MGCKLNKVMFIKTYIFRILVLLGNSIYISRSLRLKNYNKFFFF